MKIGDEVFVHGYVDEIRKDCVIIRNDGGYFGTIEDEIVGVEIKAWHKDYVEPMVVIEEADTPQTEETCERCVYVRGSQWCQGCNGTPKRWDGEKIVDTPQPDCKSCKQYGAVSVSCDRCDKSTHSNYEP